MKRSGVVFVGLAICCVLVAVWISLYPLASAQPGGSLQRWEYLYITLEVQWCHEHQEYRTYIPHRLRKAIWDSDVFVLLGNESYNTEYILDELGNDGWELVDVIEGRSTVKEYREFVFKRSISL